MLHLLCGQYSVVHLHVHVHSTDCRAVTALCSLVYILPDTRSVPNHEKIVFFVPVSEYNTTQFFLVLIVSF